MTVLIATDIFGHTPAVTELVRAMPCHCVVVSPFDSAGPDPLEYRDEALAYQAFVAQGGVARYAEKMRALLAGGAVEVTQVIGFSAGASALWLLAATELARNWTGATLFYGSRIRDNPQLRAQCPVHLIFAEKEAAFAPAPLVERLRANGYRADLLAGTAHGFMNPYSAGYCANTFKQQRDLILRALRGTD